MPVLARKISRAKWGDQRDEPIRADAVTGDLKTSGDTLSFWRCESSVDAHLDRVVLALAAASDKPDRMDVVYFDEAQVATNGLESRNTAGQTPVENLRQHHVDIERLDLDRLVTVAKMVATACRGNASRRLTKAQVLAIVVQAVRDNHVSLDALRPDMKAAVEEKLTPAP